MIKLPPGPKLSFFDQLLYRPGRSPLEFFPMLARIYGDLAAFRMGGETVVFVNHPHHIKDILVTNNRKFIKGRGLESAKRVLGQGLLTSEDPVHLRQRRLIQPAFHRERVESYGATMVDYAARVRQEWTEGREIDVAQEMMRLTLSIAGKTLFDVDAESHAADVGRALTAVMDSFWTTMLPFADVLERLPVPRLRRARKARERLDEIIFRLIAERRAEGAALERRGDLLSLLLLAQDEEDQNRGMTDRQVRDEAMTIFLAGHETTANALTWTWYLLSGAPEAARCLHAEVDRVLNGRTPLVTDIPALRYVEQVVTESMRLYPPAWLIGRRAIEEYRIGDFTFPARTIFVTSPYVIHRDARYFVDPERFDPSRWTPAFRSGLPRFAYFPFGGGPRQCIGEGFAWVELILVVATIAQRWSLRRVPGHPVIPQPVVTLRTRHGVRMVPELRHGSPAA
jgi:cytochrome P450